MRPKPTTRRPILVLFLVGIFVLLAVASTSALSAPPEPEPELERDFLSTVFRRPRLTEEQIAAHGIERSLGTQAISAPEVGEGWSLSIYESLRTGNWDLFLADGANGNETQLTSRSDNEGSAKLDPAANRIAYISDRDDGTQIWTMNRDGSNARRLTSGEDSLNPTWSPDGTKIAYDQNTADGGSEIFVMNADGSGQTRLTYSPDLDAMPTWSPDGSRLAFISLRTGGYRVWVMNADGSNQTQLNNIAYSLYPAWSPNGARIAFSVVNSSGFLDVWVMNADGSNPHEVFITNRYYDNYVSGWSPNSELILFTKVELIYWDGDWYWVSSEIGSVGANQVSWTGFTSYYHTGLEMNQQWISLDHQPPVSSLTPPSAVIPSPYTFKITGADTGGSGIAYHSLQLRDHADGIWRDIFTYDYNTYTYFPPCVLTQGGHTYDVRVRSEDQAGNIEAWPATPNATVRTESYPPLIGFINPQRYVQGTGAALEWTAQDVGGSTLEGMSLYYRQLGESEWAPKIEDTRNFTETVGLNQGATFEFMLRARDSAGNISPEVTSGPAYQIISSYGERLDGVAHDFMGIPRPGLQVSMSDDELVGVESSAGDGSFSAYARGLMPDFSAGFSLPLYGSLPETYYKNLEYPIQLYLPPADNLLSNSHFEQALSAPESAWQTGGSLPVVLSEGMLHSGAASAALGDPASYFTSPTPLASLASTGYEPALMKAGADGTLHFAWTDPEDGRVYYLRKPTGGDWGAIELALNVSQRWPEHKEMEIGGDGAAHLVVIDEGVVLYTRRPAGGGWSAPRTISDGRGAQIHWEQWHVLAIDGLNNVHIMWSTLGRELCYSMGSPSGSWTAVETLMAMDNDPQSARVLATSQGDFYAFLAGVGYSNINFPFIHRSPAGEWEIYETDVSRYANVHLLMLDANETPVLITIQNNLQRYFILQTRWYTGSGVWTAVQEHTQEPGLGQHAFYLDPANTLHMVWEGVTDNWELSLHYARFQRNGAWQDTTLPLTNKPVFEASFDAAGTAHLILSGDQFWYAQLRNGNLLHAPILLPDHPAGYDTYSILIDAQNNPQFFQNYYIPEMSQGFQHLQIAQASAAGEASLAQDVSLPATMEHPILSLMYKLSGGEAQGDSKLSIWVDAASGPSQLMSRSRPGFNWEHAWVDLSSWAGETVTVTARLEQAAGERILLANLDEVTLGSGYPDGWLSALPTSRNIPPGEPFELDIDYGNQGGFALPGAVVEVNLPLGLELLDSSQPCAGGPPVFSCALGELEAGAQGTLTLSLRTTPAALFNQRLDLGLRLATTGSELELLNNQLTVGVTPVNALYLPSIGNWWAGD